MRYFLLLSLLLFAVQSSFSQLVPWYFQSPVFREWARENKIASLSYQTPAIDGLGICSNAYFINAKGQVVSNNDNNHCDKIDVKSFKYEYWFNENGFLDSVCVASFEFYFASGEGTFMQVNDSLINYFDQVIRRDFSQQYTYDTIREYQRKQKVKSDVLKNCRFKSINYFFDQTGSIWYALQNQLPVPDFAGLVALEYRLIQTIRYENGEPKTIREYPYYGDFWNPTYSFFTQEKRSDSLEHIAVQQPIYITENDYYDIAVGDTVIYLSAIKELKGQNTYFYNLGEENQLPDLTTVPTIETIHQLTSEITRYSNFYISPNDFRKWNFSTGLFFAEGNFQDYDHPALLKPGVNDRTYFGQSKNSFEFQTYVKKGTWKKTEIYTCENGNRTLLYTDTPYEFGIKRKEAVRYKIDANTVYFEHIGEHFRIYTYYPNAKNKYRFSTEIETKNGFLYFDGIHDYESTTSKMNITYR